MIRGFPFDPPEVLESLPNESCHCAKRSINPSRMTRGKPDEIVVHQAETSSLTLTNQRTGGSYD
jgi:hypothetical protein